MLGGFLLCFHRGDRLLKLQDRLVHNLFSKVFPQSSINELYTGLNLLKVSGIYKYRSAKLMYKVLKCNSFPELMSFVIPTLIQKCAMQVNLSIIIYYYTLSCIVRLNCAGFWRQFGKLEKSRCARCVGLETSPPLTLSPKGMRRGRAMLCGSEAGDPWWCGCASS